LVIQKWSIVGGNQVPGITDANHSAAMAQAMRQKAAGV
jgi:hypothetical protein